MTYFLDRVINDTSFDNAQKEVKYMDLLKLKLDKWYITLFFSNPHELYSSTNLVKTTCIQRTLIFILLLLKGF